MVWVKSKEKLEFVVPGRPLCHGYRKTTEDEPRTKNKGKAYGAIVAMVAKAAMATGNWSYDETKPVYVVLTINLATTKDTISKKKREEMIKSKVLPVRYPLIERIIKVVLSSLAGVAYGSSKQVVGVTAVKKYCKDDEQSIEILMGKPAGWGEMNYDLRNS